MIRIAPLSAALAILGLVWILPWAAWLGPFPAHMIRHMGLVALAAPLLVLTAPDLARRLAIPVLAGAVLEFAVVWSWHLPALHAAAMHDAAIKLVEQAMFLFAGLAVWSSALNTREPLAGAGGLLLTSMHMTLLGALLTLASADLYATAMHRAADLTGQQLGGMLMLAIGTPAYLIGGLWLTRRALGGHPA